MGQGALHATGFSDSLPRQSKVSTHVFFLNKFYKKWLKEGTQENQVFLFFKKYFSMYVDLSFDFFQDLWV